MQICIRELNALGRKAAQMLLVGAAQPLQKNLFVAKNAKSLEQKTTLTTTPLKIEGAFQHNSLMRSANQSLKLIAVMIALSQIRTSFFYEFVFNLLPACLLYKSER
jgi:hypothetical protein